MDLLTFYRDWLMDGIVPFWWGHGVDPVNGGVYSCMTEEGERINDDRYVWSQARWLWVASALYNRVAGEERFLEAARKTAGFLLRHGRDGEGRWVYRLSGDGRVLEGHTSVYADCFAVYGLNEYWKASGDEEARRGALETLARVRRRVEEPEFRETAPYVIPGGRRIHAVPMILTEVVGEAGDDAAAGEYAMRILDRFVRPELDGLLLEFLDRDYGRLDGAEGTAVMPGHAIESMWFVLHWARRAGREAEIVPRAAAVVRRHLEAGWDPVYGGIYLGIDAAGGRAPYLANAEKKIWWPHTEALYALLLLERMTGGERWCKEWYERVHEWSFAHFPLGERGGIGEWRQRLDREGRPITELIALPVKDPFHLPRAVILILELLGHQKEKPAAPGRG